MYFYKKVLYLVFKCYQYAGDLQPRVILAEEDLMQSSGLCRPLHIHRQVRKTSHF